MKSFFLTIAGTIAILLVLFVGAFAWLGGFGNFEVIEKELGPFYLVYQEHRGDYAKVGRIIPEVKKELDTRKIGSERYFGLYRDDPRAVKKDDLRSLAGCSVNAADYESLKGLASPYMSRRVEKKKYAVVEFPFKNQMSMLMGLSRVYPALETYFSRHGYIRNEVIEFYDNPEKIKDAKISYLMPVERNKNSSNQGENHVGKK
ncbi:MAG: GyrI-like domain-containing protein [Spirochaetia bacterium]|nr:GyrI-like domain-containing protein [Spirochaetia bacterium]